MDKELMTDCSRCKFCKGLDLIQNKADTPGSICYFQYQLIIDDDNDPIKNSTLADTPNPPEWCRVNMMISDGDYSIEDALIEEPEVWR